MELESAWLTMAWTPSVVMVCPLQSRVVEVFIVMQPTLSVKSLVTVQVFPGAFVQSLQVVQSLQPMDMVRPPDSAFPGLVESGGGCCVDGLVRGSMVCGVIVPSSLAFRGVGKKGGFRIKRASAKEGTSFCEVLVDTIESGYAK